MLVSIIFIVATWVTLDLSCKTVIKRARKRGDELISKAVSAS